MKQGSDQTEDLKQKQIERDKLKAKALLLLQIMADAKGITLRQHLLQLKKKMDQENSL
jgi:hypothetical protein